jgi:hypothetical protein
MLLVFGDDPQVLNGRDQVILNALSPQSAPASSLKAVLNGCLGELALLKPLPALAVRARLRGIGLLARFIEQLLARVALEGATVLITRAELSQPAARAGSPLRPIFVVAVPGNKVVPVKDLSRRSRTVILTADRPFLSRRSFAPGGASRCLRV